MTGKEAVMVVLSVIMSASTGRPTRLNDASDTWRALLLGAPPVLL